MLSKRDQFDLISVTNIEESFLRTNWARTTEEFNSHDITAKGLPILIEANPKIFEFTPEDVFQLNKTALCFKIYGHNDLDYIGFKHAFGGNYFLSNYCLKQPFVDLSNEMKVQNQQTMNHVSELSKKYDKIASFQTRNIPHAGHERIIQAMLKFCDHIVINPVIGPKKKGDIKLEALQLAFEYLSAQKYEGRISFKPIIANMYYAGPHEALHHAFLRERLGFKLFSVGRDHAGAAGQYAADSAASFVKQNLSQIAIHVFHHNGAGHCSLCDKVVIAGECKCPRANLNDISGTEFRKAISQKRIFKFADDEMQRLLIDSELELFETW